MSAILADSHTETPPGPTTRVARDKGKGNQPERRGEAVAAGEGVNTSFLSVVETIDNQLTELSRMLVSIKNSETKLAAAAREKSEGAYADFAATFEGAADIAGDCLDLVLREAAFVGSLRATLQGEDPMVAGASGTVPGLVGRGVAAEAKEAKPQRKGRSPAAAAAIARAVSAACGASAAEVAEEVAAAATAAAAEGGEAEEGEAGLGVHACGVSGVGCHDRERGGGRLSGAAGGGGSGG